MSTLSQSDTPNTVFDALFNPFHQNSQVNPHARKCTAMTDCDWLTMGIRRVLELEPSGRGFIQSMNEGTHSNIARSTFFDCLASKRRLEYCKWEHEKLLESMDDSRAINDPFSSYECLSEYRIFAGDGHYHEKATHDFSVYKHHDQTQHFYALNLRTHTLRHIAVAQTGPEVVNGENIIRKREHDMHALKRIGPEKIRMGTPVGEKVMLIWDRAVIDFVLWKNWKSRHGIYFISRLKENLELSPQGSFDYDIQDPINAGVISDQSMHTSGGLPVRLIVYKCPATGETYEILTSNNTLPPGIIVYLYKVRWDIEKVFDEIKIKCKEGKSWASSAIAKEAQAVFICLAHNVMIDLEDKIKNEENIHNKHEEERKSNRAQELRDTAARAGKILAPMYSMIQRISQRCAPFIRWIRNHLRNNIPWSEACGALKRIYGLKFA